MFELHIPENFMIFETAQKQAQRIGLCAKSSGGADLILCALSILLPLLAAPIFLLAQSFAVAD
jgi:hypothetical protein